MKLFHGAWCRSYNVSELLNSEFLYLASLSVKFLINRDFFPACIFSRSCCSVFVFLYLPTRIFQVDQ